MVNLGGEKMSKSTGHLVGVESAVAAYGARALRLLFVRAHYRSPIEYSESLLVEAAEALDRLDRFLGRVGEPGLP
jgi:cysteinyl-tRNA synthetase